MPTFRLSIRLLDGAFHGRGTGGEPQWPPSPLRAFQALVNAAARRWREPQFGSYAVPALLWLEGLGSPAVVAPPGRTATRPHRLYVPNNAGDLMIAAWARGNSDASMAEHRTERDVRPTRFAGSDRRPLESNPDFLPIHYDWPLTPSQYEEGRTHLEPLKAAARSITHLGWGVDQAVGHAELLVSDPPVDPTTERWLPVGADGGTALQVPKDGTLADLRRKHADFLNRLAGDGFQPVSPLTAFAVVGYRRATDVAPRPFAAFALLKTDGSRYRPFDPVRRAAAVAGMVRNAVAAAARDAGWCEEDVNTFVHGHTADGSDRARGADADQRFAYLPLPSLERRGPRGEHVGMIRRVLVTAPPGRADRVTWVRRALSGRELIDEHTGEPVALVSAIPDSDRNVRPYVGPSAVWSTVTPVVMPGYDDGDREEGERLLRRAFEHAGLPRELVDRAVVEWRPVGFRAGVDLASRYQPPRSAAPRPTCHVRVRWPVPVAGPLAVGACRYRGLGVLAAEGK